VGVRIKINGAMAAVFHAQNSVCTVVIFQAIAFQIQTRQQYQSDANAMTASTTQRIKMLLGTKERSVKLVKMGIMGSCVRMLAQTHAK